MAKRKTCSIPCDGQKEDMLNSLWWPWGRHAQFPAMAKGKTCSILCDGQEENMLNFLWWSLGETFPTPRDPRGKIGQFPVTAIHLRPCNQSISVFISQVFTNRIITPADQTVSGCSAVAHSLAGRTIRLINSCDINSETNVG